MTASVTTPPPVANLPAAPSGSSSRGRTIVLLLVAVAVIALLVLFGRQLSDPVKDFAQFVSGLGPWAGVVFIAGYALATVLFAPGSVLTLAAGAIFGLAWGTLYVFIGATIGASLAFLVARYGARRFVEEKVEGNPRFASIDRAVAQEGRKVVFLLRLSPIFPFNLLNYALGLTRVRFLDYLIACIGMLPGTFLYVYYGKAIGSVAALASGASASKGAEQYLFLGLGLVATVVVTIFVTKIAKRALARVAEP